MDELGIRALAARALEFVRDGQVVGLGTGHAATAFVEALGRRVQAGGLKVHGVPTSQATETLARRLGIPLVALDDVDRIDLDIDGADEVDPNLDLIKGLGGALVREKIVAAGAQRFIALVGSDKMVPILGSHGDLPLEVIPFARGPVQRRLKELGYEASLRQRDGHAFVSDNGNYILDCRIGPLPAPAELDATLRQIPGVVGTGLFLGMAHLVLCCENGSVHVKHRPDHRTAG